MRHASPLGRATQRKTLPFQRVPVMALAIADSDWLGGMQGFGRLPGVSTAVERLDRRLLCPRDSRIGRSLGELRVNRQSR
jgi:hypothetical protein